MIRHIRTFIYLFLLWVIVGVVGRLGFLAYYQDLLSASSFGEQALSLFYGLRLDMAVAGYLMFLPGLMLIVSLWYKGSALHWLWRGYTVVTAFLVGLAYVSNIGLYSYWGFPLDSTSLLYLRTSPADAMASLSWEQVTVALAAIILLTIAISLPMLLVVRSLKRIEFRKQKLLGSIVLLILTALLIIPIRGGFGTGTNHTGSVYFSDDIRMNHATVNPVFSFVESALHQEEIGSKYRFMSDEDATKVMEELASPSQTNTHEATDTLKAEGANLILISLESFSKFIMSDVGRVRGVTPCLDSISRDGLYFTRFYANTFRTDRALVAIHSALPAQTTMSIMDQPRKSTVLPSIARTLSANGYATAFYYGGDINYSNMRSYFVGTGFQKIVSDADFPRKQHTGKWGVADGPVYERIIADIEANKAGGKPFFYSLMTSSSHEPFDVPDYNKIPSSPELNAFSYADMCLGRFIKRMRALPCWDKTIIVIVSDHLGAYPKQLDNYELWRYEIPLIITGGALPKDLVGRNNTVGCQTDIAATVLSLLGYGHEEFKFSKNLLDAETAHYAIFTFPDAIGLVKDKGYVIYDNTTSKTVSAQGDTTHLTRQSKAYLQKLYDYIEER